jgi:uncharacterized membrane protein YukC
MYFKETVSPKKITAKHVDEKLKQTNDGLMAYFSDLQKQKQIREREKKAEREAEKAKREADKAESKSDSTKLERAILDLSGK